MSLIIRNKRGIARLEDRIDWTSFPNVRKNAFIDRAPGKDVNWFYNRVTIFKE